MTGRARADSGGPRRWRGAWVCGSVGLALAAAAGCAATGLSRAEMDAAIYADCVRSGGTWRGTQEFGGSCLYRGPSR